MKEQSRKGFLARILENNREFDSTVAVFFVFMIAFSVIAAIIVALFTGKQVPDKMFDLMNVFENFILMILSLFFHKSHSTGQWHGSDDIPDEIGTGETRGARRNEYRAVS